MKSSKCKDSNSRIVKKHKMNAGIEKNLALMEPTVSTVRRMANGSKQHHIISTSYIPNSSLNVWQNDRSSNCSTITKWKFPSTICFTNYVQETKSFYLKEKKTRIISEQEMLRVLHLSQQNACKQLDCSISTLKRRFYELKDGFGLNRWPQYFSEIRHLPIFQKIYPMSLKFILNSDGE